MGKFSIEIFCFYAKTSLIGHIVPYWFLLAFFICRHSFIYSIISNTRQLMASFLAHIDKNVIIIDKKNIAVQSCTAMFLWISWCLRTDCCTYPTSSSEQLLPEAERMQEASGTVQSSGSAYRCNVFWRWCQRSAFQQPSSHRSPGPNLPAQRTQLLVIIRWISAA